MSGQTKQAAEPRGFPKGDGPIDLAHLERATFGDRRLRDEVLTLFLRQAMVLAVNIAEADGETARAEAAHTLKGAALGIGAHAVAEAAAALEQTPADAAALVDALARLAAAVAEARAAATNLLRR